MQKPLMSPRHQVLAWTDGQFVNADSPTLPMMDQAYLSGMGAFETMLAEGGAPLFLDAHFRRLAITAACFELEMPDIDVVANAIKDLLRRQHLESARIRITISGMIQSDGMPFRFGGKSRTAILAFPLHPENATPQRLTTAPFRVDSASPLAGRKCTSYALHALAMHHARTLGYDDALMLDHRNHVVGSATGNIFWAKDGDLFTPDLRSGCRDGVTRERVIRACEKLGIQCSQTLAEANQMVESDEVFTTSSIRGIRCVSEFESHKPSGEMLTNRIRDVMQREKDAEIQRI